jgi:DNA-binding MarR family transcriptional regulator
MVRVLADHEWLEVVPDPAGGNRNRLELTRAGQELLESWGGELETRLADLLEAVGVPYGEYLSHTARLLDALDSQPAGARAGGPSQPGPVPGRV